MTELLLNYLGGRWQAEAGSGTPLIDLMPAAELVGVNATGLVNTALELVESHGRVQVIWPDIATLQTSWAI